MIILAVLLAAAFATAASFSVCFASRFVCAQSIYHPPSFCDHCKRFLRWWQLIPIFGWLIQLGRCYFCHRKITAVSFIAETCFSLGGLIILVQPPRDLWLVFAILLWLFPLALQDWHTNQIASPYCYFGSLAWLVGSITPRDIFMAAGWLMLAALLVKFKKLGNGDWWVMLAIAALGAPKFNLIILLASLLALSCNRWQKRSLIPFVAFLWLALVVVFLITIFCWLFHH